MCHTPRRNRSRRHDDMKRPGLDNKAKTRPLPALNGPKGRKAERLPPNKHLMITLAAHHSAVSLSSSVSMSPWQTQSHNLNYFSFKSKMESWMYLGISGWGVGGGGWGGGVGHITATVRKDWRRVPLSFIPYSPLPDTDRTADTRKRKDNSIRQLIN